VPPKRKSEGLIAWTTMTYRSVLLAILFVVVAAAIASYMIAPHATTSVLNKTSDFFGGLADKLGLGKATTPKGTLAAGPQEAHFTAIDGTVRVKKTSSNTWVNADYNLPLEKGDVVQTSSDGIAKVVFADGTNYTVKPDSLIVVQENSTNAQQQTQVAVQVTTGTVDLSTATFAAGSKSQVSVAGATATLAPDTAALVHSDPRADEHDILVKRGTAEVQRGSEVVRASDYEKVSFKSDSPQMTKEKEAGPPTLISPANMAPVFFTGKDKSLDFSWTPMPNVNGYHLRISRNRSFSSVVYDRKLTDPDTRASGTVKVSGLGEGTFYWVVQSLSGNKESVESETNRFDLIPKGTQDVSLKLEIEPFVQHGHVIEITGRTEAAARVMVNGEEVPLVSPDGSFHYFTPPLPNGENVITITAQNSRGGVSTQQKRVVIQ
jgi:hypothetical protein